MSRVISLPRILDNSHVSNDNNYYIQTCIQYLLNNILINRLNHVQILGKLYTSL